MLNIGRAGMKTSEFWIALIVAGVAVALSKLGTVLPWQAVTVIICYILSRTILKSTVARNGGK